MNVYKVGLDIGSTTTKMVVLDKDGTTVLFPDTKGIRQKHKNVYSDFFIK